MCAEFSRWGLPYQSSRGNTGVYGCKLHRLMPARRPCSTQSKQSGMESEMYRQNDLLVRAAVVVSASVAFTLIGSGCGNYDVNAHTSLGTHIQPAPGGFAPGGFAPGGPAPGAPAPGAPAPS